MARGFTQYGAKNIVGRQPARPVRGPGRPATNDSGSGNRNTTPAVTPASTPPTTTPPTVPTVPSGTGNVAAGWLSAATAGQAPRIIPTSEVEDAEAELAAYLAGEGGVPSNGITVNTGGGGLTTAQKLARQDAIAGAKGSAEYLYGLLAASPDKYAPLFKQITDNQAALEGGVTTNYDTALAALLARVGTANTETTTNYDALRARLEAAAPRAYANLPAATAPTLSQDAVSRYAQAIGAPTQAIGQAAVQAAAPYAGTADAYNRLIENLKANEAAGQASRLAGVDMGRTSTASRIGAQNLSSTNALDVQKNAALAQILQAIQGQQLGVSQQELAYRQTLEQALLGAVGTGYVPAPRYIPPPPTNADGSIDFSGVDFDALGRLMRGK